MILKYFFASEFDLQIFAGCNDFILSVTLLQLGHLFCYSSGATRGGDLSRRYHKFVHIGTKHPCPRQNIFKLVYNKAQYPICQQNMATSKGAFLFVGLSFVFKIRKEQDLGFLRGGREAFQPEHAQSHRTNCDVGSLACTTVVSDELFSNNLAFRFQAGSLF